MSEKLFANVNEVQIGEGYVVMVRTPDGDRVFDPCGRPEAQAQAIADNATKLAKKNGWDLSYFISR